jgi:hypothetical protein
MFLALPSHLRMGIRVHSGDEEVDLSSIASSSSSSSSSMVYLSVSASDPGRTVLSRWDSSSSLKDECDRPPQMPNRGITRTRTLDEVEIAKELPVAIKGTKSMLLGDNGPVKGLHRKKRNSCPSLLTLGTSISAELPIIPTDKKNRRFSKEIKRRVVSGSAA